MSKVALHRYRVPIVNLGTGFEGYRILQWSDLHLGRPCPVEDALDRVRDLPVDLVVLTGDVLHSADFVEEGRAFLEVLTANLSPRDGFVAVLGNHDSGAVGLGEGEGGIRWLNNDLMRLERGDDRLNVVGLDQRCWAATDVCAAFRGVEGREPTVVLGHFPLTAALVGDLADVVLSGHTHGGQIRVPGLPFFTNDHLGWRHGRGLTRVGGVSLVVSAGLGYSGPFSFRFFSKPELVLVELASEGGRTAAEEELT